jgi:hypothetical protein
MILDAIRAEIGSMLMPAPQRASVYLPRLGIPTQPAAIYIATLGLMQVVSRRWPTAIAWWDPTTLAPCFHGVEWGDIKAHLIERALANNWTAPLRETKHPLLGNAGRRSLLRGVVEAREWLSRPENLEQHAREIDWLCIDGATLGQIKTPARYRSVASNYWNLGTICPGVLAANGSPYGNWHTPWLAVLAWEALPWLDAEWTERALTRERLYEFEPEGARRHDFPFIDQIHKDLCQWVVPVWHTPTEVRRCGVWFGRRGKHLGSTWSRWTWSRFHNHPDLTWQTYGLRRLLSDMTWEFCNYGPAAYYPAKAHEGDGFEQHVNSFINHQAESIHWITRYRASQHV